MTDDARPQQHSSRVKKLVKARSLEQHRARITRRVHSCGSQQECLDIICDAITDLNAAVAKLLDAEMTRAKRKAKR